MSQHQKLERFATIDEKRRCKHLPLLAASPLVLLILTTHQAFPMRKILVGAQLSLDGIMQAPGGTIEDPSNGFRFGGWAVPYFDQVGGEEINRVLAEPCDLLLGRKTYEIFAAYWPYYNANAEDGGIAELFRRITKYVVSSSANVDTSWAGTVLLRCIDDVRRLREESGPNLVTQGSTELVHALLAHDLVDAISTFTVPVVLGMGKKLFADGSAPHSYRLTRSRVSDTGLVVAHYERAGEVMTADVSLDTPSDKERARQERMKREDGVSNAPEKQR